LQSFAIQQPIAFPYVPPYVIADKDARKYELLGQKASAAYQRRDKAAYDRLRLEQQALGKYRPWMSHSPTERSPTCVFHRQILQDFVTIDEIAEKLFQEIAIFEPAAQTNRFSIKAIFGWLISRIFH
jgi:hypothetical protein